MSSPYTEEQGPAGLTPAVLWLLVANVAVFFLQQTVVKAEDLQALFAFDGADVLRRWWTPLTYAFLHGDIWHIAFNMIALWQFGPRVEKLFGTARFVRFYLWCALGGVALHYFVFRWFITGQMGSMIGASAAVFGVMYAFAHAWPRTMLLFFGIIPMQVRWAVMGFAIMSLLLGVTGGQSGVAHFAHLGGFLAAFLLVRLPAAKRLSSWPERFSPTPELPEDEMPRSVPRTSGLRNPRSTEPDPIDDVVARSNAIVQRRPPAVAPQKPVVTATVAPAPSATEEMNALLDKMSNGGGRESLTSNEHARLRELSELLRNGQR